jgi:plasmid segregation protein ParM
MGELAEKESNFPRRSQGLTKANQDVLIRILVAVHRFGSSSNKIVVGQPIEKHIPEEKEKIINMLKGKHTLTLNDETKTFYIEDVRVASEGASSWFGWFKQSPNFRIIDCGSGTVNIATIRDWNFNDRESFTMKVGTRTTDIITPEELVDSIISRTTAFFEQNDLILLVGGIAPVVYEQIKSFYPNTITFENSKFANAMGFFNIARSVYND